MSGSSMKKTNRLINEKSPYLRQHAYNPVNWLPWNEEALERAHRERKPIFLSIGYSACHWCHVMKKESFENREIASIINENFIPIKVDREERPDLDEIYMKAVQLITGSGGWPLNVFLTPTGEPFYGGTYFPPKPRAGMPSLPDVLRSIARLWRENPQEITREAKKTVDLLRATYSHQAQYGRISEESLENAFEQLVLSFDEKNGGFGPAPKFPMPGHLHFLMRYYKRTGKSYALKMVTDTLQAMMRGGIRDHLGGGFHRYATDDRWIVPHFEKMLYDNALLVNVYLDAYQINKNPEYRQIVHQCLEYILREMTSPEGGFYTAQDADTEGEEGRFYVWTLQEIEAVLEPEMARAFSLSYGVTSKGNFEGRNTLHIPEGTNSIEQDTLLEEVRKRLLSLRDGRVRPTVDDKILSGWNGLMISAMARAHSILNDVRFMLAAVRAAEFVLTEMVREGTLLRRYSQGQSDIPGFLEDYTFLIEGLINLYEATFEEKWLIEALKLAHTMITRFSDPAGGFYSSIMDNRLFVRAKEAYDGAIPSGNSVAALVLLRLAHLTHDDKLKVHAQRTLETFRDRLEDQPLAHLWMLSALDFYLDDIREIAVVGTARDHVQPILNEIPTKFLPNKVFACKIGDTSTSMIPWLQGKIAIEGKAMAYVCQNYTCKAPVTTISELQRLLS